MKISDKINRLLEEDDRINEKGMSPKQLKENSPIKPKHPKTWYSYEYFPPKTTAGKLNSLSLIRHM